MESSRTPKMQDRGSAAVANGEMISHLPPAAERSERIDVIELLLVLAREKKRILQITVAVAVVALIVVLILPKTYTATATILPPQQNPSSVSSLMGQLGSIVGLGEAADLGLKNPADLFVAMLQSRTVADRLINRFDLRKAYRVKRYQDARKKLAGRSEIVAEKEGLISIAVADVDPKRAADMANAYVDELHAMNSDLAITEAAQRRVFYQQKLDAEREELAQSELALKQAQEKSGLIQPEAQGRAIIDTVANARAQVAMKEVQLQSMRTYGTESNPDVKRAEQELAGLRAQLAKLERSSGTSSGGSLEIPTRQLPEAQLEYIRRARDLKYHEELYEFLGKQREAAQIDEARDAVLVQVVDKAVEPERKSGPHRLIIVLVSAAVAFLLSCLGVLVMEALRRKQQDPNEGARLAMLWDSLKFSSWNS